jgi:hypothetical protein
VAVFRTPIILFLFIFSFAPAFAEDTLVNKWSLAAQLHHGFLLAHRPLIVPLQQNHIYGTEVSINKRNLTPGSWQQIYGYPETGLSVAFWNLGNSARLGKAVTVIPYINYPVCENRIMDFSIKFGWGLGYVEKIFDADHNYKNVAIGSHLNFALTLQPRFSFKLSESMQCFAGPSITHFSNGSIVTPNLGINLVTFNAGLDVKIGKKIPLTYSELEAFSKKRRISVFTAGSVKQIYPANGKYYFAATLSLNYALQQTRKSAFGLGADLFYDNSIHKKLEERNLVLNNKLETLRSGIYGSYELIMADLTVVLNMGGYLYTKLHNDGTFYHRFGLRYRLTEKLFICMNLKSHWGKADYVEWGIGYQIEKVK